MLRQIAILINIIAIFLLLYIIFTNGLGDVDGMVSFLVLIPVLVNFFALLTSSSKRDDNWIALYFKRKAAEEKKRIKELTKD